MHTATLTLLIIVKFFEFIFLCVLTTLMIPAVVELFQRTSADSMHVNYMAAGCFVLAAYHTAYNTILYNCRYRFKTSCFTLGKFCVFDAFNYICL